MIGIWVKFNRGPVEKIDTAPNMKTARYLVQEYQMAYGPNCTVWCGRKKDGP